MFRTLNATTALSRIAFAKSDAGVDMMDKVAKDLKKAGATDASALKAVPSKSQAGGNAGKDETETLTESQVKADQEITATLPKLWKKAEATETAIMDDMVSVIIHWLQTRADNFTADLKKALESKPDTETHAKACRAINEYARDAKAYILDKSGYTAQRSRAKALSHKQNASGQIGVALKAPGTISSFEMAVTRAVRIGLLVVGEFKGMRLGSGTFSANHPGMNYRGKPEPKLVAEAVSWSPTIIAFNEKGEPQESENTWGDAPIPVTYKAALEAFSATFAAKRQGQAGQGKRPGTTGASAESVEAWMGYLEQNRKDVLEMLNPFPFAAMAIDFQERLDKGTTGFASEREYSELKAVIFDLYAFFEEHPYDAEKADTVARVREGQAKREPVVAKANAKRAAKASTKARQAA